MTTVALPSGTTDADRFARSLALLIGPSITAVDGSLIASDLRVLGGLLAGARATVKRAVAQAHVGQATDLLGDLEGEYGLADGSLLPTADRQARLLAKYRSRAGASAPAVLATARTLAPDATLSTNGDADGGEDGAGVFLLALLTHWPIPATSSPTYADDVAALLARLDGLVAALDPLLAAQVAADESWSIGVNQGFRLDDPSSLLDLTLL